MHMSQLMPLPLTVSCFSKIQIGFAFLVPAHPGSPGKGPLNGCVCVCVTATFFSVNTKVAAMISSTSFAFMAYGMSKSQSLKPKVY